MYWWLPCFCDQICDLSFNVWKNLLQVTLILLSCRCSDKQLVPHLWESLGSPHHSTCQQDMAYTGSLCANPPGHCTCLVDMTEGQGQCPQDRRSQVGISHSGPSLHRSSLLDSCSTGQHGCGWPGRPHRSTPQYFSMASVCQCNTCIIYLLNLPQLPYIWF